jgi:hypothetical protein
LISSWQCSATSALCAAIDSAWPRPRKNTTPKSTRKLSEMSRSRPDKPEISRPTVT